MVLTELTAGLLFGAAAMTSTPDAAVTVWAFDGTSSTICEDSGSLEAHATLISGDRQVGVRGRALLLDGQSDYASIDPSTGICEALGGMSGGTISVWFRFDHDPDYSEIMPIFYVGTGEGGEDNAYLMYEVGHFNANRFLYLTVLEGMMDNGQFSIPLCFRTPFNLTVGEWYHAAVTIGPEGNVGYLNGQEMTDRHYIFGDETSAAFYENVPDIDTAWLGRGYLGFVPAEQFHHGALDEIQVFDEVLTPEAIASYYDEIVNAAGINLPQQQVAAATTRVVSTVSALDDIAWSLSDQSGAFVAQDPELLLDVDLTGMSSPVELRLEATDFFGKAHEAVTVLYIVDLDRDGDVDIEDMLDVIAGWGQSGQTDIDGDGTTTIADLLLLLEGWGG